MTQPIRPDIVENPDEAAAEGTARPGHSEHHLGTTVDFRPIGETDVDQSFGDTPTGQWLEQHSWEYGFLLSYPRGKESVTCYKYEPWHFRYVGRDLARRVHDSDLALREYLWHWEVSGTEPTPAMAQAAATSTTTSAPSMTAAAAMRCRWRSGMTAYAWPRPAPACPSMATRIP